MTKQEIFNTVATHLFTQGVRASSPDGDFCFYRAPDGKKCAVGCLIPDELYKPDMEHTPLNDIIEFTEGMDPALLIERALVFSLRTVHDAGRNWGSTETMRKSLFDVAVLHELDGEIVKTLSFKDR